MSLAGGRSRSFKFVCEVSQLSHLEPARGLNRRFRRGKRGRIILARSAIAVEERMEGLKKRIEGSYESITPRPCACGHLLPA